eukprot:g12168.t1
MSGVRRARQATGLALSMPPSLSPRSNSAGAAARNRRFLSFATRPKVVSPGFQPSTDTRKGISVVGCGRMGQIRAEGVLSNPGTRLVSVVDPDREQAVALAERSTVPAFWSLEDALTDPLCDAVWIAGPTPLHLDCIRLAAEAGKAVAVEKPVAGSVKDILESHAVCLANNVPLYCSFQRRIDRTYEELAAAVRSGAVGAVRSVHAIFRDHPVPPIEFLMQGGDIFHDLAPHDVDFVCFSLGLGEPSEVYATSHSFLPQLEEAGVKDSAHCLFTFPSGAVFTLEMTRCSAYGYDNRIEVMGEKGMLSLGNPPSSGLELLDSQGCSTSPPEHSFPQRFREAYAMEIEAFEIVLRGNSEPSVTCHDSCRTTHIAEQASVSARRGRPIAISFEGIMENPER